MPKEWVEHPAATEEMNARSYRVQVALIDELNRQSSEGASTHELVAGIGAATADLIATRVGPHAVAKWFQAQADIIAQLEHKPN